MGAFAILNELREHGVTLELKDDTALRAHGVLTDTLRDVIRENRDELLVYLKGDPDPTPCLNKGVPEKAADKLHYHLPPILLSNLMLWVTRYHELRLEHPTGLILDAQPHHVVEASEAYPWGVVYDPERYLLASWGDVPTYALRGKRDLETGDLLMAEQAA